MVLESPVSLAVVPVALLVPEVFGKPVVIADGLLEASED